jgi:hypothetical protein
VIASDQDLVTVETMQSAQSLAIDHHIAKVIYLVCGTHSLVPTTDHFLVHFVRVRPRPELDFRIVRMNKAANTGMTKVRVAD